MDAKEVVKKCMGCKALNCSGCPVEARIEEMLSAPKVLQGVMKDLLKGSEDENVFDGWFIGSSCPIDGVWAGYERSS
jgi:hypothetical protein